MLYYRVVLAATGRYMVMPAVDGQLVSSDTVFNSRSDAQQAADGLNAPSGRTAPQRPSGTASAAARANGGQDGA